MAAAEEPAEMTAQMVRDMFTEQKAEMQKLEDKVKVREDIQGEQMKQMAERMDTLIQRLHELEWKWKPLDQGGGEGNLPDSMQETMIKVREIEEQMMSLREASGQRWFRDEEPGERGKHRGWDTRRLKLDPYSGDKKLWRSFVFTIKAFIRRESPHLELLMSKMEHHDEEITEEDMTKVDLDFNEDKELAWTLTNFTSGEAKEQVQLLEGKPGLEIWRMMTKENDPKSGTSGVQAPRGPRDLKFRSDLNF